MSTTKTGASDIGAIFSAISGIAVGAGSKVFGKIGDLDIDSILEKANFNKYVEEELKSMAKLNIINIGKTGVGKSTIINAVFEKELAKTGTGKPVTTHLESYAIPDSPITIYDSKGLETDGKSNSAILEEIHDKIKTKNSTENTKEYIHICWYCVSDGGNRLDEYEINAIKDMRKMIPVIIVLTQSVGGAATKEFIGEIEKFFTDKPIDIIPVMAIEKFQESEYGELKVKSHGLTELVNRSYDLLPESVAKTFAAHQNINVELKINNAKTAVAIGAAAVGAAAFQPLPLADAPIMIAIQIGMLVKITACFGLNPSRFSFKTVITGLGGPFAAAIVGRTLVSLLKVVPVVGTAAGGAINPNSL